MDERSRWRWSKVVASDERPGAPSSMYALAVVLAASSNSKTTSTNPVGTILFLVVIMAAAYVFFLRPRSQAARRQRETLMELGPGDEVLTGAGIFGTVLDVAADRVTIETATPPAANLPAQAGA